MGILSRLFRSRDEPIQNNYSSPSYLYLFGQSKSGAKVNPFTAMQHSAVYACVKVLAESVAQLPLHLYERTADGKKPATEHPLYRILHDQPNPEMTSYTFRETMMTHLLLYGNAYAQILRDRRGEVAGLYPLPSNRVRVDRDASDNLIYVYSRYDKANPNCKEQGTIILQDFDVMHIPGLSFDGLVGYSPIAMARNAIGMALSCDAYGASFYANGAAPSGVLEHPGTIKDPKKLREAWEAAYGGTNNAHKTAVLEEGVKYQPISLSPEDSQFLETRKFQIEEIARLYRVPLHMIGDLEHATFSNIEQQSLEFVQFTLMPWLTRWEQEIQRSLIRQHDSQTYFAKFNVEGFLRGDYASRMQGYATARQNGWMSANDIREKEDENRIPAEDGGDSYLVNGSFTKLADAGAFAGGENK